MGSEYAGDGIGSVSAAAAGIAVLTRPTC